MPVKDVVHRHMPIMTTPVRINIYQPSVSAEGKSFLGTVHAVCDSTSPNWLGVFSKIQIRPRTDCITNAKTGEKIRLGNAITSDPINVISNESRESIVDIINRTTANMQPKFIVGQHPEK